MKRINGRTKGAAGEREAAKWLQKQFNLAECPQRNLEQVRAGGFDLIGFPPFAFEIKRSEKLDLRGAWVQAVNSCNDEYHIPVVMYRKNSRTWFFLVSAKYMGLRNGFVRLEDREFMLLVDKILTDIEQLTAAITV